MRAYDPKLQDVCEFAIAVIQKKNTSPTELKSIKNNLNKRSGNGKKS